MSSFWKGATRPPPHVTAEETEQPSRYIRHRWLYDTYTARVIFPRTNPEQPAKQTFDKRSEKFKRSLLEEQK